MDKKKLLKCIIISLEATNSKVSWFSNGKINDRIFDLWSNCLKDFSDDLILNAFQDFVKFKKETQTLQPSEIIKRCYKSESDLTSEANTIWQVFVNFKNDDYLIYLNNNEVLKNLLPQRYDVGFMNFRELNFLKSDFIKNYKKLKIKKDKKFVELKKIKKTLKKA